MSRWRVAILLFLVAAPLLFLIGAGSWWLWREDLWFKVWWPMAACLATAYLLSWWWQRRKRLLPRAEVSPANHWTTRDEEAWHLVEARAKTVAGIDPSRLTEAQFYFDTGKAMAEELARFYHPRARDPIGSLTIPEILAVVELAAHDLAELVDRYLPGGHMLTIDQWRKAGKIGDWYTRASNIYWIVSAVFSPVNTAARYAAAKLGLSRPLQMLQENVLAWFYTAYVHRVGTYLIELNSGRLRVGAERYRELTRDQESGVRSQETKARQVTITVMGQVKAGKSSLINALLGERRAATDVLPRTKDITRYHLSATDSDGTGGGLDLLDTVGYAHSGPRKDQVDETAEAVQQSDLVLLVMHARDPARQPDVELLQSLETWFQNRPHLKIPPILGVLTHIDLLSPLMEWSPPYSWVHPKRPKEQNIHAAVAIAREQIGDRLGDVLPVCVAEGRVFGVQEWLLPRIIDTLGEARAVALVRCLHAEADAGKVRKLLEQLLEAGKQLVKVVRSS